MIIEDKDTKTEQLIHFEKIKELLSLYKFPLILATIGFVLLLVGIVYIFKSQNISPEVVFSSEASPSGKIKLAKIHVDVEGAVMSPGVYKIEEGNRITAALAAAGGLSAQADREWVAKNLNLAAKLIDGGKIYIPSAGETGSRKITNDKLQISNASANKEYLLGVATGKVNINSASQADIEGLPGVGSVNAMKIINGRPYQTIEELKSKKILGNALYNKIKDLITL